MADFAERVARAKKKTNDFCHGRQQPTRWMTAHIRGS